MTNPETTLSIGELARRAGVTVRAVRLYERAGLLTSVRAENGRRMFAGADVQRLRLIVALKRIGLTLAQCRDVLAQDGDAFAQIIDAQLPMLRRQREALDWSIAMLVAADAHIKRGGALDPETLVGLVGAAEELKTLPRDACVDRYYDKSQLIRLHRRRPGRDQQKEAHAAWLALIREIEAMAIAGDPSSAEAQAAAARLNAFKDEFAQGDADVIASLRQQEEDAAAYYAGVATENEAAQPTPSSLSKRGWLFISRARGAA
jgi:DNA-binding transcriptional MerR regulator